MFPDNFFNNFSDFSQVNSTHFSTGVLYPTSIFTRKQFIVDIDKYPTTIQEGNFNNGSQLKYYYKK